MKNTNILILIRSIDKSVHSLHLMCGPVHDDAYITARADGAQHSVPLHLSVRSIIYQEPSVCDNQYTGHVIDEMIIYLSALPLDIIVSISI